MSPRTETETVEQALELVTFWEELLAGIESIAGTNAVEDVFRNERP
jgi:hypothetical protein